MTQLIKRYSANNPSINIDATSSAVTQTNWANFVMSPGVYDYNGSHYDLSTEGLYLFLNVNVDGGYRHIYSTDLKSLLSSLAHMINYGIADETLTNSTLANTIKTRKIALRCGPTASFVQSILNSKNIQSRQVSLVTASSPTNFDDGHVVLEVKIGSNWVLFDLPSNRYYQDLAGIDMSLRDYFNLTTKIAVSLSESTSDNQPWVANSFASDVYYDMAFRNENDLQNWINRIYQLLGIWNTDGLCYFYMPAGTESRQAWLLSLSPSYRVISYSAWLKMFY